MKRRTLALLPLAVPAVAQWQPERSLTMIVAFAAGGGTDVAARTVARFLERELGQPVIVLNRPGAGGEIGFSELARARPDGLTIGFINTPNIITTPIERAQARFQLEDFSPIANLVDDPGGLWVRPDSEFRDLMTLLDAARARPESIGYGSTGVGSDDHLAMLALERASGTRFLHVPFAGAAQVRQNVIGRTLPLACMNMSEGLNEMRQGLLRPLAQMGAIRWSETPDVPTLRELAFDVVEGSMRGIAGPAGLPAPVLTRLTQALRRMVDDPAFQEAARAQSLPLRFLEPGEYLATLRSLRAGYQALWSAHPWRE